MSNERLEPKRGKCDICNQVREIFAVYDDIGSVCVECDRKGLDVLAQNKAGWKRVQNEQQFALWREAERLGVLDRLKFLDNHTCVLDGKVRYSSRNRRAQVKGKTYQMRGFEHFMSVFGEKK